MGIISRNQWDQPCLKSLDWEEFHNGDPLDLNKFNHVVKVYHKLAVSAAETQVGVKAQLAQRTKMLGQKPSEGGSSSSWDKPIKS